MNLEIKHLWSHKCPKKWDQYTLIALVITIIVLLILAGITINLTIGQDGILRRAEEAGENYVDAAQNERNQLDELTNTADNIIANVIGGNNGSTNSALGTIIKTENNINYTSDGVGNIIPVPVGFGPITLEEGQGTKETGFVIRNDNDDNEFVWIPVDITTPYSYERVAFSKTGWAGTQTKREYDSTSQSYKIIRADKTGYNYTETMPTIGINRTELDSVTEYGGFYIGRYEAGIASTSERTSSSGTEDAILVQKEKIVYNYIKNTNAKIKSEALYTKESNNVISRLCSSYAWDTALKFIETKNPEYPTNSTVGNYSDKVEILGMPALTGQTEAVNNIYDMGGNVFELTTERYSYLGGMYSARGGNYNSSASASPAANRFEDSDDKYRYGGFRITLFL